MSDIDILIEMAKQGPLKYEDVMDAVNKHGLDCSPSVVLEVCCLSRGWDCGALSYLFGVVTTTRGAGKALIVSRYTSSASVDKGDSKDPASWQQYPFNLLGKCLKC